MSRPGRHPAATGPDRDRVGALRSLLATHTAADARERASLARTLAMLDWLRDPFDEHADPTHVTGSAIVLDRDGRVLLHRHKRLRRWLQPGGHLDDAEAGHDAAAREAREETGVRATHPAGGPVLVHVDVHEGPRGHVHLDLRYLLNADGTTPLAPAPGESRDVAWFTVTDAVAVADTSLRAAILAATTALDAMRGPRPSSR